MTPTVIASLPEARAALEAARSGGVVAELESPPDAASIYGVLWFAELNRALLAEFPGVSFTLTLDCGNRGDLAHAALVEGIKRVRFNGHPETAKALRDIASQANAELVDSALPVRELLYVIAEPDISAADRDWIGSIRGQHDPQCDLLGPHFTLVFGTDALPADDLVSRSRAVARWATAFAFEVRKIEVFPAAATNHYIFLIPGEGARELSALHQALRVGAASDAPFTPHITIGRASGRTEAATIADEIGKMGRAIRGRVTMLKVIAVAGPRLREVAVIQLGSER